MVCNYGEELGSCQLQNKELKLTHHLINVVVDRDTPPGSFYCTILVLLSTSSLLKLHVYRKGDHPSNQMAKFARSKMDSECGKDASP